MKRSFYSLFLLVVLGLTACGRSGDIQNGSFAASSAQCSSGKSFAAEDGCNSCTCRTMSDGSVVVMCTQMVCLSH